MRRLLFLNLSGRGIWVILLVGGLALQPLRAEKPGALKQAWQEYQFLSMEVAEKYFNQVLKGKAEPQYKLEATLGLAMVNQFREQKSDLATAKKLYGEVLAQNPPAETRMLVLSFQADLHIKQGEKQEALEILNALIKESPDSVIGQDALIRKMLLTMGPYGSQASLDAAAEVEKVIDGIQVEATPERPYLLPIIHYEVGMIYFWAGDYEKAVEHLTTFTTLGNAATTSYGSQSSTLYRIAKIYENYLHKPAMAGKFYRRIINEYPNSGFAYYSLEKAISLKSISREEVEKMRISGVTEEILDELFATVEGEDD